MNYEQYYNSLSKPFFAPPSEIFGIVWPFLYIGMAVSFGWVFYRILITRTWSFRLLLPFLVNILSNALYSLLFFNLKLPLVATVDILIVLSTIVWIMVAMWHKQQWVSYSQIPYLLWVSFATILQITILVKNW